MLNTNLGGVTIDKCCICKKPLDKDHDWIIPFANDKVACTRCLHDISDAGAEICLCYDPEELYLKTGKTRNVISPRKIYDSLSQDIIGQEKAKKILSVAAYNHYARISSNDNSLEKTNILLIGPSGSGKTSLVKTLAKSLDLPVAISSATSLTEAGYIGNDVESIVQNLFHLSGYDINKTEHGIIFIDEIDKLSSINTTSQYSVGHIGVQQALLPILEGTMVGVSCIPSSNPYRSAKIMIDTSNILFICGGAFPDIEKIISKRTSHKSAIGFSLSRENDFLSGCEDPYQLITCDDIREFGIIPELIGRLPVIASFEKLSESQLVKILTEPSNSLITQYRSLFSYMNIDLIFEGNALDEIAHMAYIKNTGARALRSIMENLLLDLMFDLPSHSDINVVIITRGFVLGNEPPTMLNDIFSQAYSSLII